MKIGSKKDVAKPVNKKRIKATYNKIAPRRAGGANRPLKIRRQFDRIPSFVIRRWISGVSFRRGGRGRPVANRTMSTMRAPAMTTMDSASRVRAHSSSHLGVFLESFA